MSPNHFSFPQLKIAAIFALVSLTACGADSEPPATLNFDRPTDMAFACYGDLRVSGTVGSSAQPLSSCREHVAGNVPVGQEGVVTPSYYGFVLQPSRGTMAVVHVPSLGVVDNDPLTPGLNDIPVGSLPVGVVEDASGCFMVTANSGSCDLSNVDISSAIDRGRSATIKRTPLTSPSGDVLLVKPRSIASGTQIEEVGNACPAIPSGNLYVSYPDCKIVAVVDPGTGAVQSGVVFREDGSVEIAGPADYAACPKQCGDTTTTSALGPEPDAGGGPVETFDERPVHMQVSPDGTKLYIAGEGSPLFTIVTLDAAGMPTTDILRIRVEGDVGILKFAVTDRIDMGGDEVSDPRVSPIGEFQFAYLITTDSTVRVLDLDNEQECDTQVDPRFLANEKDVEFLSCMPVGDIRTPGRRAGARSPGIHLPGRFAFGRGGLQDLALPLDIRFANLESAEGNVDVSPDNMSGTFAYISVANGFVFIVNVDDNYYSDFEDDDEPTLVDMPLAVAHQIRDNGINRHLVADANNCSTPAVERNFLGPRQMSAPTQLIRVEEIAGTKIHQLPFLRGLSCNGENDEGESIETVVSELSYTADVETRELAFPDIRSIENQEWSIMWEGALSGDTLSVAIDGPLVRSGVASRQGERLLLQDSSAPFCGLGVEDFDIASLVGCDPLRGDAQCGVSESCYVHPESSGAISSGVCVGVDKEDAIAEVCRDFYISKRRYTVVNRAKSELELAERRRVLKTSPLDGCQSDTQCQDFYLREGLLVIEDHPIEAELPEVESYSWVCEADPSRAPSVDRCVMSCSSTSDCEDAFFCSSGRCVEAPLPPAECLSSVQRYQVLAGEAFTVLGADDGFLHSVIADELTGECITDPDAHILNVGRLPLRPPACDDDGDFTTGPNPCSLTVSHTEQFIPYVVTNGKCEEKEAEIRTREVSAVRFSNPAVTFHMVDSETQGDLECREDQAGTGPAYATVYDGYQVVVDIGGGFSPKSINGVQAALPITMVTGPSGNIWVLDQGDENSFTGGRIFRFNPRAPSASSPFEVSIVF